MADAVLNALQRKLAAYEAAGLTDLAARTKKRIVKLEKKSAPAAEKSEAEKPAEKEK